MLFFVIELPSECNSYFRQHSVNCLQRIWQNAGCNLNGKKEPGKINSTKLAVYQSMTIKYIFLNMLLSSSYQKYRAGLFFPYIFVLSVSLNGVYIFSHQDAIAMLSSNFENLFPPLQGWFTECLLLFLCCKTKLSLMQRSTLNFKRFSRQVLNISFKY